MVVAWKGLVAYLTRSDCTSELLIRPRLSSFPQVLCWW